MVSALEVKKSKSRLAFVCSFLEGVKKLKGFARVDFRNVRGNI